MDQDQSASVTTSGETGTSSTADHPTLNTTSSEEPDQGLDSSSMMDPTPDTPLEPSSVQHDDEMLDSVPLNSNMEAESVIVGNGVGRGVSSGGPISSSTTAPPFHNGFINSIKSQITGSVNKLGRRARASVPVAEERDRVMNHSPAGPRRGVFSSNQNDSSSINFNHLSNRNIDLGLGRLDGLGASSGGKLLHSDFFNGFPDLFDDDDLE